MNRYVDRYIVRENKQSNGKESEDTREAREYQRRKTTRIRDDSLNHATRYRNITCLSRIRGNWTSRRCLAGTLC
jgi:hypothetical protein